MNSTEIIIICLLTFLVLLVLGGLFFLLVKKNKEVKKNKTKLYKNEEILNQKIKELEGLTKKYEDKIANLLAKNKVKKELINYLQQEKKQEWDALLLEAKANSNLQAANILISAMQSVTEPIVQENSITLVLLEDEQLKGKLIGKEGRNKKTFEMITGTELIIDKDNHFLTISSFNPIRRELAKRTLEKLIKTKNIDSNKIELVYKDIKHNFEKELSDIGKDIVEEKFQIKDLNPKIYPYIGRMKYRSSFGQNTLNHIVECTELANYIAKELQLDEKLAMKAALLHDLGKSIDYESNTNHVDVGLKIAKELKLDPIIINAIESHHNNTNANNIYSEIVKIVDTISASRPGARLNSSNEYFQRVQKLEELINNFDEVNNTYVLKAGRYIRIIVNPIKVKDQELAILGKKIKETIESDELTKGYNLKVCLIKENKYEFETDNKLI